MEVTFNIIPVPASRPRVTRWSTYYGKKYTNFKEEMLSLTSDIVFTPLEGNIFAQLQFNVPIPKSWTKKKKEAKNGAYCDNHADIDNYCKAILDSLNGVYYEDDKQIVMLWATEASIDCTFTTLDSHSNARFAPMPPMSPFGNN
jgi:Holliday junction resolvase RusA-like endonuclease